MALTSNLRDARLVGRALTHDSAAFAELLRKHMPAVSAVAMAYTRHHADAEDVAQEAFLKAWQSLDTLRVPRRFGGWVVTIARNIARTQLNRRRHEAENLEQYRTETAMARNLSDSDARDARRELLPVLVAELPESDRELVLLRYQGGKKTREIAELLAISHAAVRKRLERIRYSLGQALLTSLEPDTAEKTRCDRRASQIASAVVAISPAWNNAVTGIAGTGALGVSPLLKAVGIAFLVPAVLVVSYLSVHKKAPVSNNVESSIAAPVKNVETVAEAVAPTDLESAAEFVRSASSSQMSVEESAPTVRGQAVEHDAEAQPQVIANREDYGRVSGWVLDEEDYPIRGAKVTVVATGMPETMPASPSFGGGSFGGGGGFGGGSFGGTSVSGALGRPPASLEESLIGGGGYVDEHSLSLALNDDKYHFSAVTGPDGKFSVDGIAYQGVAIVRVTAEGYMPADDHLVIVPGEVHEEVLFTLRAGVPLRGRVLSAKGDAVSDARLQITGLVAANGSSSGRSPSALREVPTDGEGYFTLMSLDYGSASLLVSSPVLGDFTFTQIAIKEDGFVELMYPVPASVQGQITWHNGEGLADGTVTFRGHVVQEYGSEFEGRWGMSSMSGKIYTGHTDAQGRYLIANIDPGTTYLADIADAKGTILAKSIEVGTPNAGEAITWDYAVSEPILVRGTIYDANTRSPIAGIHVRCNKDGAGQALSETTVRSATDGTYELRIFSGPGTYTITPGYSLHGIQLGMGTEGFYARSVELAAGQQIQLDLEIPAPCSRSFRVIDTAGNPVVGARVSVKQSASEGGSFGYGIPEATGPDGRIQVDGLIPDAEIRCVFSQDGYVDEESLAVSGRPGEEVPEETIVLYPPSGLAGTVVDEAGDPISDGLLKLIVRYGDRRHKEVLMNTDAWGAFELRDLIPATELTVELVEVYGQSHDGQGVVQATYTVSCVPEKVMDLGTLTLAAQSNNDGRQ